MLRREIAGLGSYGAQRITEAFSSVVEDLVCGGIISPGPDERLRGQYLETRTAQLFRQMGFVVERGPRGAYDARIPPPTDSEPSRPCVVEVKSSSRPGPTRRDLRQLDDWVFEMSGEQEARKHGLGGKASMQAIGTCGWFPPREYLIGRPGTS